ncbi:lytic transglycosylase domain-containing protein [Luteimonas sp. RIT-PG2_3]
MLKSCLHILPVAALWLCVATADAQTTAPASDLQLREALQAAERGQPVAPGQHPAQGWIEYATLRRNLDTLPVAQAEAFLKRWQGQAVAETFRAEWLRALYKRQDWAGIRNAASPSSTNSALRCITLDARQRGGSVDAQWTRDLQSIWRGSGKPLPSECDGPFAVLASRGELTEALRWERIDQAAAEWDPIVMRAAANGLPADQRALATDYAAFLQSPSERALAWPKTERSRLMASHGLARLAKADPLAAEAQLARYAPALGFSEADNGRVLYQAALWTVASYLPDSARLLNRVPESAYDDRLHEWRVREALSRSDWAAARAAIAKMGDKQRNDSRWTWFAARTTELGGDKVSAQALYQRAATASDFHGFLAADRLNLPYQLCPLALDANAGARNAVANDPAMVRAMALYRIDRSGWATREWAEAVDRFDDTQRRYAVEIAIDNGWFDRAVFGLNKHPDDSRYYTLRFPLHHTEAIQREARAQRLDPAWIAAEIRAESVFNPLARSPANARGLMQVLPTTGQGVARRLGLAWGGADSLYDPDTNIALGTAYLREKEDMYGFPYIAIAAYNAGPTPTARWQAQRPAMDPDFWIETISYKETRDYVARILAFSVIYDWRMYRAAVPVSDRMRGIEGSARKKLICPAGKA